MMKQTVLVNDTSDLSDMRRSKVIYGQQDAATFAKEQEKLARISRIKQVREQEREVTRQNNRDYRDQIERTREMEEEEARYREYL